MEQRISFYMAVAGVVGALAVSALLLLSGDQGLKPWYLPCIVFAFGGLAGVWLNSSRHTATPSEGTD